MLVGIRYTSSGKRGVTVLYMHRANPAATATKYPHGQLQKRFHALHHLILVVPSQDRSDPQCNCIIWTLRCKGHFKAFTVLAKIELIGQTKDFLVLSSKTKGLRRNEDKEGPTVCLNETCLSRKMENQEVEMTARSSWINVCIKGIARVQRMSLHQT